jgi:hypothetical protein
LPSFNQIWGFSTDIHEKSNFMEIHPARAALTWVDRRKDMTTVIGALCNYVNMPKSQQDTLFTTPIVLEV